LLAEHALPAASADGRGARPSTDIDIEAREIIKMRERLSKIIATETGQSIERVRTDTDRNYWMSASEAIDYGLAYKIVRSVEDLK
jgi:ATP-dependent Clp protease protease subunit